VRNGPGPRKCFCSKGLCHIAYFDIGFVLHFLFLTTMVRQAHHMDTKALRPRNCDKMGKMIDSGCWMPDTVRLMSGLDWVCFSFAFFMETAVFVVKGLAKRVCVKLPILKLGLFCIFLATKALRHEVDWVVLNCLF